MSRDNQVIFVTGASGYIASRLIPRLLEQGYPVRALARDPDRLQKRSWYKQVEMVKGDLTVPGSLPGALHGVRAAYYLVHGMASGKHYPEIDLVSARNFATAAEKAGLEHIIYLGGLADPRQKIGRHMRSRIETGDTLRQGKVPVTEFRASLIIGSGSISFEMIRYLTEQLPLLVGPVWFKRRTQPIAARNILDYLVAALENPAVRGNIYEIGCTDIMTYAEAMLRYATLRGLRRKLVMIPVAPLAFMAYFVEKMTPVPARIAYPLIDGMQSDSIIGDYPAKEAFPTIHLLHYEESIHSALEELSPDKVERVWDIPGPGTQCTYTFRKHEGFLVHYWQVPCTQDWPQVVQAVQQKSVPFRRRYTSDGGVAGRFIRFYQELPRLGKVWFEWQVSALDDGRNHLTQTVFIAPHGVLGFLYGYLRYPYDRLKFTRHLQAILRQLNHIKRSTRTNQTQ